MGLLPTSDNPMATGSCRRPGIWGCRRPGIWVCCQLPTILWQLGVAVDLGFGVAVDLGFGVAVDLGFGVAINLGFGFAANFRQSYGNWELP